MKRLGFVLLALGLVCQPSTAQAQLKLGYIDSAVLMEKIPKLKNVQRQMEQLQQRYDAEARDRQSKLAKMQEDFQKQELLMSEAKKGEMRVAFQAEAEKLDQFVRDKFGEDGELTSKHISLTAPILDRINKILQLIGEEEGFDFIFDVARNTTIVYAEEKYDLTQKVLGRMEEERAEEGKR